MVAANSIYILYARTSMREHHDSDGIACFNFLSFNYYYISTFSFTTQPKKLRIRAFSVFLLPVHVHVLDQLRPTLDENICINPIGFEGPTSNLARSFWCSSVTIFHI